MISAELPKQIFVTGTNTGIGKTLVSAILMAGLRGKYWKPVQSGLEEKTDTDNINALVFYQFSSKYTVKTC